MATAPKMKRALKRTVTLWREDILPTFDFTYEEDKVIKAVCRTCKNNIAKIKKFYRIKLVLDVLNYKQSGMTHILKPNLTLHLNFSGYHRCLE